MMNTAFKKGGRREGAGRPKTGRSTKVIRVAIDFPDPQQVEDLLEILRSWKEVVNRSSSTSPRWEKARQLFQEIEHLL